MSPKFDRGSRAHTFAVSRKPEFGEVLDKRFTPRDGPIVVYSEGKLSEPHMDIVLDIIELKLQGVWVCRMASGKDQLVVRNDEGKLVPAIIAYEVEK